MSYFDQLKNIRQHYGFMFDQLFLPGGLPRSGDEDLSAPGEE